MKAVFLFLSVLLVCAAYAQDPIYMTNDLFANSVRMGRGGGSVATNTVVGAFSLGNNTSGTENVGIGYASLASNTTGYNNLSLGSFALNQNQSGFENMAIGAYALYAQTTGAANVAVGNGSLASNTTGNYNTAIGPGALISSTSTSLNVGIGYFAGRYLANGANNQTSASSIFIGFDTRAAAAGQSNQIVIGSQAIGQGSNTIMLGNSSVTGLFCYDNTISSPSDRRDKTNIQGLNAGLDFVKKLRPVVFDWNMRDGAKKGVPDVGFIAQELESVQNEEAQGKYINLTSYNKDTDQYFAQNANLIPVLVKAIQEQQALIDNLQNQVRDLMQQNLQKAEAASLPKTGTSEKKP
jgi:hypothetical protein